MVPLQLYESKECQNRHCNVGKTRVIGEINKKELGSQNGEELL